MLRSPSIATLASALAKAQGEIKAASKDAANPFFKSHYSTLASIIDVIRKPFADNGIAFMQMARTAEGGVEVETVFVVKAEAGDEFVSEVIFLPVAKADAQGIGSAITYAKRYALQAMAGVPSEDDDGNAAAASVKTLRDRGIEVLAKAAKKGQDALKAAWEGLGADVRKACANDLPKYKEEANAVTSA